MTIEATRMEMAFDQETLDFVRKLGVMGRLPADQPKAVQDIVERFVRSQTLTAGEHWRMAMIDRDESEVLYSMIYRVAEMIDRLQELESSNIRLRSEVLQLKSKKGKKR